VSARFIGSNERLLLKKKEKYILIRKMKDDHKLEIGEVVMKEDLSYADES
jgi:hypothetical protein